MIISTCFKRDWKNSQVLKLDSGRNLNEFNENGKFTKKEKQLKTMWLLLECQRFSWKFHVNVFIRFECRLFFLRFKLVVSPRVKNGDYTMWSAALRVPLTPLLQNQFLFVGWGGLKCLTSIGRWEMWWPPKAWRHKRVHLTSRIRD